MGLTKGGNYEEYTSALKIALRETTREVKEKLLVVYSIYDIIYIY